MKLKLILASFALCLSVAAQTPNTKPEIKTVELAKLAPVELAPVELFDRLGTFGKKNPFEQPSVTKCSKAWDGTQYIYCCSASQGCWCYYPGHQPSGATCE